MTRFHVIIPARFGSSRFPGKVLTPIAGRPMVEHVFQVAVDSGAVSVTVATDDERVVAVCRAIGAQVYLTASDHLSGSDRIAECTQLMGLPSDAIVVNLQADEPLTPAAALQQVAQDLARVEGAEIATLCAPIAHAAKLHNPDVVKVVLDQSGYALYFSRAPIPWARDAFAHDRNCLPPQPTYRHHLGIYGYRTDALQRLTQASPSAAEQAECLEQLRWLHWGARIHVSTWPEDLPAGVDTEDDLVRVERMLGNGRPH